MVALCAAWERRKDHSMAVASSTRSPDTLVGYKYCIGVFGNPDGSTGALMSSKMLANPFGPAARCSKYAESKPQTSSRPYPLQPSGVLWQRPVR